MRVGRLSVWASFGAVCVLIATGAGGTASEGRAGSTCPTSARASGAFDTEAVIAAVRREMPKLYAGLTDMGEPVPINARTYEIDGVIRLGYIPRAFARETCGRELFESARTR